MTTYKEFKGMDVDKLKYANKAKKKLFKIKGNKYIRNTVNKAKKTI